MRAVGAATCGVVLLLSGCSMQSDEPDTPDVVATASPTVEDWRPVDSGPREGAMGTTTLDDDGVPVSYVVVEGDTADLIRLRFDIWWDSLAREDGRVLIKYPEIYAGEVLIFVPPGAPRTATRSGHSRRCGQGERHD